MDQASPPNTGTHSRAVRFDPRRVYVAAIAVPLLYGLIVLAPPLGLTVLVFSVAILAAHELFHLALGSRPFPPVLYGGFVGIGLILAAAHWPDWIRLNDALLLTLAISMWLVMRQSQPPEHRLTDASLSLLGVLYVGLTLSAVIWLRTEPEGLWLVCFLLLVTWAGDTGAYYVGSLLGRHPLAPRLSPKKSVEGLAGGFALSLAAALAARAWFLPTFSLADCIWTSLLLTLAGLFGDLAESALKRGAGVKDSGTLLPGHGGMLDRLDSLLCTAPAFYYYVTLIKG